LRVYKLKNGWVIQYSDGRKRLVYKDYTLKDVIEIIFGRFLDVLDAIDLQFQCEEYFGRSCTDADIKKYIFEKYFGINDK